MPTARTARAAALTVLAASFLAPHAASADPIIPRPTASERSGPVTLDPVCSGDALHGATDLPVELLHAAAERGRVARSLRPVPKDGDGLEGRLLALSAGHGILVQDDGTDWGFQRDITNGLREDIHTNQWMIDFIIPMLERSGAELVTMREFTYAETALIVDDTSETYAETGTWTDGASDGWRGGYRYAGAGDDATATWSFTAEATGSAPIYAYYLSGTNRATNARYTITHAGGTAEVVVDQTVLGVESFEPPPYPNNPPGPDAPEAPSDLWRVLGTWSFEQGETYEITLHAAEADGVVIADAMHVGGGMGTIVDEAGNPSGRPRWEESALSYVEWLDAPDWIRINDVSMRPLYAIYRGVDAYVSLHTNCCNNSGTSTWTWYPDGFVPESSWPENYVEENLPPGTYAFSDYAHDAVVARIRATWDDAWDDEGHRGADFGEIRALRQAWYEDVNTHSVDDPTIIPGFLMEVAYHDTRYDASMIRELDFRYEVARGLVAGIHRYFNGEAAIVPPTRIEGIRAATTDAGLEVVWETPVDALEPTSTPTHYTVWTSTDGVLFERGPEVEATGAARERTVLPLTECEALYVKVTASNEAGHSLDSPVVGGQRAQNRVDADAARVLVVQGIDREVSQVTDPPFLRTYARTYGPAVGDVRDGIGFDITTDELLEGALGGRPYDLVVFAAGETSTRDDSVDLRAIVALQRYLGDGGRLLISGAEIGWDLVEYGTETDVAFFETTLGARYAADDAGETLVTLVGLGEVRAPTAVFGDCTGDAPCVEYPDVLVPEEGGTVLGVYGPDTGEAGAIVQNAAGTVVTAGFPLESITDPDERRWFIAELGRALLDDGFAGDGTCELGLEPPADVEPAELPDAGDPPEPPLDARDDVVDASPPDASNDVTPDTGADTLADALEDVSEDISLETLPPPDTDVPQRDAGDDGERGGGDGGCGCTQSPADNAPAAALALLGLVALRRRSERTR